MKRAGVLAAAGVVALVGWAFRAVDRAVAEAGWYEEEAYPAFMGNGDLDAAIDAEHLGDLAIGRDLRA